MTVKYEVHNQLTGLTEQSNTFDEAKILQARIRNEYMAHMEGCFAISVLVQNEDESWTQGLADENGQLIVNVYEEG